MLEMGTHYFLCKILLWNQNALHQLLFTDKATEILFVILRILFHHEECTCRLRNIAMRDYQESVTSGQTHTQTDAGQSDPYVPLCFAGDTKTG